VKAIIPFKKKGAKSRLQPLLNEEEREEFAQCILKDVLIALSVSEIEEVTIISTSSKEGMSEDLKLGFDLDLTMTIKEDTRELNTAINDVLTEEKEPLLIIMADLPLTLPGNINEIIGHEHKEDVIITPGRRGGTNALFLRRPSDFFVSYYGSSYLRHIEIAKRRNLTIAVCDSFFIHMDMDEVEDLIDLLIYGEKSFSAQYLRRIGVSLHVDNEKRVSVNRQRMDKKSFE
jgi:2-phospho-L-lactate guanylyltransferase